MARHGMPLPPELEGAVEKGRRAIVVGSAGGLREGLVREVLRGGFAVQQCDAGFAAGVVASRFQPDVVVLLAAGADGGETLAGLRADPELAAIPVVAIGPAEWAVRLRSAGAALVLSPPFGDGALVAAASQALSLVAVASRRGS